MNSDEHTKQASDVSQIDNQKNYWKANLKLLAKLLVVWFTVSFGCGIILADWLDQFSVFGFKLGFWFAQQGAIYVFVALIFVYARQMKLLDRQFGVGDENDADQESQS
ncbi:MAG: putative solute:sodium symporter small subunit [Porticoccaceae bacterium]|jgi:putative solute:sodium symporter small subunit|tara:strand:- start:3145 stop:3468 length:324 start_codon:yes stop_codon:yes gene_type:complete